MVVGGTSQGVTLARGMSELGPSSCPPDRPNPEQDTEEQALMWKGRLPGRAVALGNEISCNVQNPPYSAVK